MTKLKSLGVKGVAVLLLLAAAVASCWLAPVEATASRQIDAGLGRALVSFAAARGINAVISLAQGTEVSLQPLGVGVNLAVGQVLDPINDVIETFSNLMLLAAVAFGIQKVLVTIGAHWAVSLALTAAAVAWAGMLLFRQRLAPGWLAKTLVILLMVRFAVPVATIGSDFMFRHFLLSDYQAGQQALERTAEQVDKASPSATLPATEPGLVERLKGWASAPAGAGWKERFDNLRQVAERATQHVIRLMVVFILQTLVAPLLLLWLLYLLARSVLRQRLQLVPVLAPGTAEDALPFPVSPPSFPRTPP